MCVDSTSLAPGINPAQGVFIEMFVTSYLVLAVLMLAVEKHHVTPFAPVSLPRQVRPLLAINTSFPDILGRDRTYSLRWRTVPNSIHSFPTRANLFS